MVSRAVPATDADAYRAAFRGSAMTRAKLPMLERNAAVVSGNVGTADDADVLTQPLAGPESPGRGHAASADPDPRVAHAEHDAVGRGGIGRAGHPKSALPPVARLGELARVRQQVEQHLLQLDAVGAHGERGVAPGGGVVRPLGPGPPPRVYSVRPAPPRIVSASARVSRPGAAPTSRAKSAASAS